MTVTDTKQPVIAYLCPRINFLKTYAPAIVEQIRNGFSLAPALIIPGRGDTLFGNKNNTAASREMLQHYAFYQDVRILEADNEQQLLALLLHNNVKAVVNVVPGESREICEYVMPESRKQGVRWCAMGSNGDELRVVARNKGATIEQWDLITTVNCLWKRWLIDFLAKVNPAKVASAKKIVAIGNPEFDQQEQCGFDRKQIREKYKLPRDKKIIFTISPPTYSVIAPYRRIFLKKWATVAVNLPFVKQRFRRYARSKPGTIITDFDAMRGYETILKTIREFADRNNAIIICKRRNKDKITWPAEKKYLDRIFDEGSFYPFRTLELLYAADMYIGFESHCVLEAIAMGTPAISLIPVLRTEDPEDVFLIETWKRLWCQPDPAFHVQGVSDIYITFNDQQWNAFRLRLRQPLEEQQNKYRRDEREKFMETFFGGTVFNASRRFLNAVETVL